MARGLGLIRLAASPSAIAEAQASGARLFELIASTGLARLLRDQGNRTAARDILAPVYGWFTKGLDSTPHR